MKKPALPAVLLIILFAFSCEKDPQGPVIKKESIGGFVQKGPFINGSSITVSELEQDLTQTGKTFNTQISDNKGSFELRNLELSSQYAELKADGFYFNEINGKSSSARLTMYALSDLTDKDQLNVNIMSHLEKGRVTYLVSDGMPFTDAKKQAQKEILNIFSLKDPNLKESEMLDISKDGDDNAILLAISVIIQGFRTEAEMSGLLANINTDIREDGILDSPVLGTELINDARLLDTVQIRKNLTKRYQELGIDAAIPDFEKYLQTFIDSSDFEFTKSIAYPERGSFGENILFDGNDHIKSFTGYSMAADLPTGTKLTIILKGGLWYYQTSPNGPVNWTVSAYDFEAQSQTFTSTETGKNCDLNIEFADTSGNAGVMVEYYENGSKSPVKTRKIMVEAYVPGNPGPLK